MKALLKDWQELVSMGMDLNDAYHYGGKVWRCQWTSIQLFDLVTHFKSSGRFTVSPSAIDTLISEPNESFPLTALSVVEKALDASHIWIKHPFPHMVNTPLVWQAICLDATDDSKPGFFGTIDDSKPGFGTPKPMCDCGAVKARTTHADWCSTKQKRSVP